MLKLIDIQKVYGEEDSKITALNDINLEFGSSGLVSILGQSGCGKTTILNIIGGLDSYSSGDLVINGVSTKSYRNSDWDAYRNNNVGFVFQTYYLIPHLNVLENIMLAMDLSGVSSHDQKLRAYEALERVGVADQAKKKPKQLSGGQAQRVAIARAIVNKPGIILADEPTGALDSENSVQILSLLKELSASALVILVTHNSELAEEYSDRIIKLKDGKVIFDENAVAVGKTAAILVEETTTEAVEETLQETSKKVDLSGVNSKKGKKKLTMNIFSAFKMSLKNLYYKKGRTSITAIAGCIGVVCISLILSFNAGFSAYAKKFEQDSLSKYPITITKSTSKFAAIFEKASKGDDIDTSVIDVNKILDMLKDEEGAKTAYTDEQKVFILAQLSSLMDNVGNLFKGNDTTLLKQYIDENFDKALATIKYDYNLNPNVYRINKTGENVTGYTQLNPYSERLINSLQAFMSLMGRNSDMFSGDDMDSMVTMMNNINVWDMMVDDEQVIKAQYDVLSGNLPKNNGENGIYDIVLVVDKYNQITDNMLYALGYIEFASMFASAIGSFLKIDMKSTIKPDYGFDEFINKEYKVALSKDNYVFNSETSRYEEITKNSAIKSMIDEKGLTLRISGIVRIREDVSGGCLNGVIGYPQALAEYMINTTNASDMVILQQARYQEYLQKTANKEVVALQKDLKDGKISVEDMTMQQQILLAQALNANIISVITGEEVDEAGYNKIMEQLNVKNLDSPEAIYIYPKSVEAKDKIVKFINEYNASMKLAHDNGENVADNSVEYTNELDGIMSSLTGMIDTITYILVAITCLAVLVSLFMVGIIMYISVQDRTKEIGVLRSMGARNFDIMTIFNSETVLLGLISGIIGVGLSYILKYPINAILKSTLGISGLIRPVWWYSLILIGASVVLTLISGVIPAIAASRKDPVTALKAE